MFIYDVIKKFLASMSSKKVDNLEAEDFFF